MSTNEPLVLARVTSGKGGLERVWPLTPYEVEIILEDVRRAGRQARLELMIARGGTPRSLAGVRRRFERLARRGVEVRILEDPDPDPTDS